MKSNSPAKAAFLSFGLSRAVPLWLLFRQSLQNDTWRERASSLCNKNVPLDDSDLISRWLSSQSKYELLVQHHNWLMLVIGGVLGASTMIGALSYSGNEPVNVWLLLGLFCFAPLIMSIASSVAWLKNRRSTQPSLSLWETLIFRSLRASLSGESLITQSRILKPWLMWKMQGLALSYQIFAIATFLLVLTFRDIAFGWSSTLIQNDQGMPAFFNALSVPWAWISGTPSAELIANSRFYRGDNSFDPVLLSQWWSYILMAMICYGFLPRFLLSLWMKHGVKKILLEEIYSSGAIDRFLQAARFKKMPMKERSLDDESGQATMDISLDNSIKHIVAWQYEHEGITVETTLGKSDWESDEAWLRTQVPSWQLPVVILVSLEQTPTAELSDVSLLIRELNPALSLSMVLFQADEQLNDRRRGQKNSWQYFAQENNIEMAVIKLSDIVTTP